jgi:hypothetical protein
MKRMLTMAASVAALGATLSGVALWQTAAAQEALPPGFDRGRNESVSERSRPDYDPQGVQVRALLLRPEIVTEVASTDNVTAADTNEQSDIVVRISPRLTGQTTWSRHAINFTLAADKLMFVDLPKNDEFSTELAVDGRLDLGRDGSIFLGLSRINDSEGRTSPDQPFAAASPVEFDVDAAYLGARYTFGRVRISAQARQRELDFDDAATLAGVIIDQDERDRTESDFQVRGEVALSPSIALVGQAQVNNRDYDLSPPLAGFDRDSNGRVLTVGANFDLTSLVRGEVMVGYLEQEYDDAAIAAVDGLALDARLDWFPTQRTTVTVLGRRSVIDTGFAPAAAALHTEFGASLDHELRRNVLLAGAVLAGQRDYEGLDREDDLRRVEFGVRVLVNPRAEFRAGYAWDSQSSNGSARDRDFDVNTGFVSLTLRL